MYYLCAVAILLIGMIWFSYFLVKQEYQQAPIKLTCYLIVGHFFGMLFFVSILVLCLLAISQFLSVQMVELAGLADYEFPAVIMGLIIVSMISLYVNTFFSGKVVDIDHVLKDSIHVIVTATALLLFVVTSVVFNITVVDFA